MKILFMLLFLSVLSLSYVEAAKPVKVIITAGQSNTDGRVSNEELPWYIAERANQEYTYCKWSMGSLQDSITGEFTSFWPRTNTPNNPNRWAYDAVTYHYLEQALQEEFYVIKWAVGGTAIDTAMTSTNNFYWSADSAWLAGTNSTATGGQSLLLSFEENIASCIDNTLSKLEGGYEIIAFLWHQGESDHKAGCRYYDNLKGMLSHVRHFLVTKTGEETYDSLPFICGTVSRKNRQYNPQVEEALYQLAQEDKNFHVIDMSKAELQDDKLHFTARSAEYLGIEMYKVLVNGEW